MIRFNYLNLRVLVAPAENAAVKQEKHLQESRESTVFSYHAVAVDHAENVADAVESGNFVNDVSSMVDLSECTLLHEKLIELNRYLKEIDALIEAQSQDV